jgi:aspartyl-tRNA(Asn)/glutamyl-tRNA(Gln) amidotransferase subunit A
MAPGMRPALEWRRDPLNDSIPAAAPMLTFTIEQLAGELRSGALSAGELLEQCFARIDQHEHEIHAWVLVDRKQARGQARQADDELRSGHDRGWLHGMPLGIKDIIDVRGWPTLAGSPLRAGHVAENDADLVARLRERGAVFVGKTVTTEFAGFDPAATRNPWNMQNTPGGSSSGSAAAVALRMCVAAIGSQTGGSITRPASFCGVFGCKPTLGLVSVEGVVPVSLRLDHPGPIARSARDLAIVLEAIAVPDRRGAEGLAAMLGKREQGQPPRLGVLAGFFAELAAADAQAATRQAVAILELAGAKIEHMPLPPEFDGVHRSHRAIMAHDTKQWHAEAFLRQPEKFGPQMAAIIEEGLRIDSQQYAAATRHQQRLGEAVDRMCRSVDALLTPATVTAAPSLATTGDPRFNSPWSFAGVPTVSLPCSLSADALPCAIQLIGASAADAHLLQVADWCEHHLGFEREPAILAAGV